MELRHLKYFVAVAEELHFGRAAEKVQITQPVISDQIRRLEQELGVKLFFRTKRTVELTEPGKIFFKEAKQILERVEKAVDAVQKADRGELGSLMIGYTGPALYTLLPKIIRTFRDRYPQVELVLKEICTNEQVEALNSGNIEVGFLHPPVDGEFEFISIMTEKMVLALPEDHPLTTFTKVPISKLSNQSFILFPRHEGLSLYNRILLMCQQAGFAPKIVQEVTPQPTMIGLVAAGIGVSLVSESLQNINRPGVVYRKLDVTTPELELVAAWKKEKVSPVLPKFLQVVTEITRIN
ncbi:MAG: LysR family transcriptional regulator [Xenococcaceae cyanobacterium MO_188.B29]|nr:LysR family transcriptional regulator [Xenococcaceae cyanobacterium MO_188.B29]